MSHIEWNMRSFSDHTLYSILLFTLNKKNTLKIAFGGPLYGFQCLTLSFSVS
jgi:hypothetical protein